MIHTLPSQNGNAAAWRLRALRFSLFGLVVFLVLVHAAMLSYRGSTLHDRSTRAYVFTENYFSDLGRERNFRGESNAPANLLFRVGMGAACVGLAAFFSVLPGLFRGEESRLWAVLAAVLGVGAALCYLGIALVPYDVSYGGHTLFVRLGFLSFLGMTLSFAAAVFAEPDYPKLYGNLLLGFAVLLSLQIAVMFFGPRSWTSPQALQLQAVAQKVVVYAEMLCMLLQIQGAFRRLRFLKKESVN